MERRRPPGWAALLVSFPLLVAVWRKLEAGAMLIAETSVGPSNAGSKESGLQAIISGTILVFGTGVLILLVALLSSTLLPSRNVLLLTLLIMVVSGVLLYRGAVKLYSRAQSALRDTFAQPADPRCFTRPPACRPSCARPGWKPSKCSPARKPPEK